MSVRIVYIDDNGEEQILNIMDMSNINSSFSKDEILSRIPREGETISVRTSNLLDESPLNERLEVIHVHHSVWFNNSEKMPSSTDVEIYCKKLTKEEFVEKISGYRA